MNQDAIKTGDEQRPSPEFMLWPEVVRFSTLSKSVIQRRMKAGDFPVPVQLSPNRVAWVRSEVERWAEDLRQERRLAA